MLRRARCAESLRLRQLEWNSSGCTPFGRLLTDRNFNRKVRSGLLGGAHPDFATVALDDAIADVKPQAGAFAYILRRKKWREELLHVGGGNAVPRVPDRNFNCVLCRML